MPALCQSRGVEKLSSKRKVERGYVCGETIKNEYCRRAIDDLSPQYSDDYHLTQGGGGGGGSDAGWGGAIPEVLFAGKENLIGAVGNLSGADIELAASAPFT